ncbi:MAG: HAMP domain-containing sensor histidine kinase [Clostridiaceae bacterium]
MQSIRKRMSILFVACSIAAIVIVAVFVNVTIIKKFDEYMIEIQNKRYENVVSYFQEVYKRDGKWSKNSGIELMHEAYMGNYYLTLLDENKNTVWGMDANEIKNNIKSTTMEVKSSGVYTSKRFEISVEGKTVGYVDIGQYSSVLMSEEDVNFKETINKSIGISSGIALIIVIGISLYFSKQFSEPIKEVANLSVSLSNGHFNIKSGVESNIEEIENLRGSVNVLAEKLRHQDMLRKRLVSDISHEIRTPLNVLQNNLEAMIDGIFPVTDERLISLNDEVVRFGRLLSNLEVLKEFESESIRLSFEEIALNDVLQGLYSDFYIAARNKNIRMNYYMKPDEDYTLTGDKDKLKQVFVNLMSNAIKFTESGGSVNINLYCNRKNIIVEFIDSGIGIKQEDLPFIFERLYRGDKSRHEIEGSGIGLTIAKNILNMHSANIEIESSEGKGTKFTIRFTKNK